MWRGPASPDSLRDAVGPGIEPPEARTRLRQACPNTRFSAPATSNPLTHAHLGMIYSHLGPASPPVAYRSSRRLIGELTKMILPRPANGS
ncbi:MAG: hypothetical protein M5U01_27785 [Ardenticatenaceae bacterium]|nr:hypothetical protein [Ardenticatenaceae bacterium]HBY95517.1 hypothetical protein [Chloroflexota bacterium]